MNTEENVRIFEGELAKVNRPGMDKLLAYIKASDFYTAPASTKFHLSVPGGLLAHSLNVLSCLRARLTWNPEGQVWEYRVNGVTLDKVPNDSLILIALLHDICKTNFYKETTRNVKNETTGKWEAVPFYVVDDKMPLGHGPKSAMIVKTYITLQKKELYAIWHHMGATNGDDMNTFLQATKKHPIVYAVHVADMEASQFVELEKGNREGFETYTHDPLYQESPSLDPAAGYNQALQFAPGSLDDGAPPVHIVTHEEIEAAAAAAKAAVEDPNGGFQDAPSVEV